MADHKLYNYLMEANASQEEIEELYTDLKYVFDNPFDPLINAAMERGCTYIDTQSQSLN